MSNASMNFNVIVSKSFPHFSIVQVLKTPVWL